MDFGLLFTNYKEEERGLRILANINKFFLYSTHSPGISLKTKFSSYWSNSEKTYKNIDDFINVIKDKENTGLFSLLVAFIYEPEYFKKNYQKFVDFEGIKECYISNNIKEMLNDGKNSFKDVYFVNFLSAFDINVTREITNNKCSCRNTLSAMENLLCKFDRKNCKDFKGKNIPFIFPTKKAESNFISIYSGLEPSERPKSIPFSYFVQCYSKLSYKIRGDTELIIIPKPDYFFSINPKYKDDERFKNAIDYEKHIGVSEEMFSENGNKKIACFFDYRNEKEVNSLCEALKKCKTDTDEKEGLIRSILLSFNYFPVWVSFPVLVSNQEKKSFCNCLENTKLSCELLISLIQNNCLCIKYIDEKNFIDYLEYNEGGFEFFKDVFDGVSAQILKGYEDKLKMMHAATTKYLISIMDKKRYYKEETTKDYLLYIEILLSKANKKI